MSDRPDLSKIKQRIQGDEPLPEEKPEDRKGAPGGPVISPKTASQIKSYARDMEKLRSTEEEAEKATVEPKRIELEELPEEMQTGSPLDPGFNDGTYYRGSPADNKDEREKIEAACSDMDFADLVITGRVNQKVPILPGKFTAEYQSLRAGENFWIERNAEKHATTDWAIRSWMGYARLAMCLKGVNDEEFPPYETDAGKIDDDLFSAKFDRVMSMGEKPVEYLLVNLNWFNDRVERLYADDYDQLKNG